MENFYKTGEFAKRIGMSQQTLRRWEAIGKLVPARTIGGHRQYTEQDVRTVLSSAFVVPDRRTVVYCRVSSRGQVDDLASQVAAMETFCLASGTVVDQWIQEIGGGMNFHRKEFLSLVDDICSGRVSKLIVAHKDRLVRFGFEMIEHLCKVNSCELVVVNQESLSPEAEMVEDLLSIVHTFSCRLYGLRRYKKASDIL